MGGLSALISLAIVAVGLVLVSAIVAIALISAPGPSAQARTTFIEKGASAGSITRQLTTEGLISNDILFRIATLLYAGDGGLKAGEYEIPAKASIRQIVDVLASGRAVQHAVTIPEGFSSVQVIDALMAEPMLTGEAPPAPAEGSVLPDTYLFARGTTRVQLLAKMSAAHDAVMAELWPKRQPDLPFRTPQEAVTLASIVEKETGLAPERPRVAALYINRLRKGIRLQADPTIIYGITKGRPLGRGIRQSELDTGPPKNPFNTYRIDGLPPSPIANPGRLSLEAVLNPPTTNELFMVADGTGGHAFGVTVAEHERNVARWREIERQRASAAQAGAGASQ